MKLPCFGPQTGSKKKKGTSFQEGPTLSRIAARFLSVGWGERRQLCEKEKEAPHGLGALPKSGHSRCAAPRARSYSTWDIEADEFIIHAKKEFFLRMSCLWFPLQRCGKDKGVHGRWKQATTAWLLFGCLLLLLSTPSYGVSHTQKARLGGISLKERVHHRSAGHENMTLCEGKCSNGCKTYSIPLDTCFSPSSLWPGDKQWGDTDVYDECNKSFLIRTFFSSQNGSCLEETDRFVLPLNTCVGPFGRPRPWGKFECPASD